MLSVCSLLCVCLTGAATFDVVADPAQVAAIYSKRYNDDPNDAKHGYLLGLAAFAQGDYARALPLFERAARTPAHASAGTYARAMTLRAMGDAPRALLGLRAATQQKNATADVWFDLGQAQLRAGDASAASHAFGEAARVQPTFSAAHYNAGVASLSNGDMPAATRALLRTTQLAPDFGPAWNGLGVAAALEGQSGEAMGFFRRAGAATAYYNLGVTAMHVGDFNAAAEAYTHAIHADSTLAPAHSNLGVVYDVLAKKEAMFHNLLRVTTLLPDFVDGSYNLGLAYFRQGELRPALAAVRRVVQRQRGHADAWLHIGEIYLQLGQPRHSQIALKTAAQQAAYGGALDSQTARRLLGEGRFAEALQLSYQNVRRFPKSLPDLIALADAAVALKQWQMAVWALGEATRLAPGDRMSRRRLVDTLMAAGQVARARVEAARAVSAWPASSDAWSALGRVDWQRGDLGEAESNFLHALGLAPEHAEALVGLARTYLARGEAGASIALLEPRARSAAQGAELETELGLAYRRLGDVDRAARWFERAANDAPTSASAWFNLGVAQFAAERPREARRSLGQALRLDPKLAEAHYFLAVLAQRAGNRSEATSCVRAALRLDANHSEAQRLMAALIDVGE